MNTLVPISLHFELFYQEDHRHLLPKEKDTKHISKKNVNIIGVLSSPKYL
jgi:hypothetical protein